MSDGKVLHQRRRGLGAVVLGGPRAELAGPKGARGGVDVHGDGSATAFTGRIVRRPLDGDDPYAALRAALSGKVSVEP